LYINLLKTKGAITLSGRAFLVGCSDFVLQRARWAFAAAVSATATALTDTRRLRLHD
jgi:hypothetical protein